MAVDVPFVVGDDGGAEIVAEVAWGLVRSDLDLSDDGVEVRETFAPNGAHADRRATGASRARRLRAHLDRCRRRRAVRQLELPSQPQLSACDNADRCMCGRNRVRLPGELPVL